MRKGRPPKLEPRRRVNIHVREDLYTRFTLLNFDEDKQKAIFGAFSDFVNEALVDYITKREYKNAYIKDKVRIEEGWKKQ